MGTARRVDRVRRAQGRSTGRRAPGRRGMFLPHVMRPLILDPSSVPVWAAELTQAPICVVDGPWGSYAAESLARAIRSWGRWEGCVWLRSPRSRSDLQLRSLGESLRAACLSRWGEGADGVGVVREGLQPAPGASTARFSPAWGLLSAPRGSVIVLELSGTGRGLGQLVRTVRPALVERQAVLVAVLEGRSRRWPRRVADRWVAADDLVRDRCLEQAGELGTVDLDRLLLLTGRRLAIAHDVLDIARVGAADLVERALRTARNWRQLLDLLAADLLEARTRQERAAIEVCLTFGYWHPHLGAPQVTAHDLRPWVVPLEGGWGMLRPVWAKPLTRRLRQGSSAARRGSGSQTTVVPGSVSATAQPLRDQAVQVEIHVLDVRLFGCLEVRIDGVPVTRWHGQRGVSVLRLLLFRRLHVCTRDELLAEFWPEVPPATARNRLQVAVSGLRRDLAEITTANVVQYADGSYGIAPAVRVSTDVERFEELLAAAEAAQRRGDRDRALATYVDAVALYRGDFASDAPYEQWTLLPRESLRLRCIAALDRLSHLQLAADRLADCIVTAQRMLESDPCREDAHRLIMRCQASLGHTYQALQQYESCRRVLRAALDAVPSPETVALYESIRDGGAPDPRKPGH